MKSIKELKEKLIDIAEENLEVDCFRSINDVLFNFEMSTGEKVQVQLVITKDDIMDLKPITER